MHHYKFYIERSPGRRRYVSQCCHGRSWLETRNDRTIWLGFQFGGSDVYERQVSEHRSDAAKFILIWRWRRCGCLGPPPLSNPKR